MATLNYEVMTLCELTAELEKEVRDWANKPKYSKADKEHGDKIKQIIKALDEEAKAYFGE